MYGFLVDSDKTKTHLSSSSLAYRALKARKNREKAAAYAKKSSTDAASSGVTNIFSNYLNSSMQSLMMQSSIPAEETDDCKSFGGFSSKVPHMNLSKTSMAKIKALSQELKFDPNDLLKVIYSESNGNPRAINSKTGASGLIQFMPATAARLGVSVYQIRTMSAEQQMDLVAKYLRNAKRTAFHGSNPQLSAGQLYALVACPGRAGKIGNLYSAGSKASRLNRGLADKNGNITFTSLENRLNRFCHKAKSFLLWLKP